MHRKHRYTHRYTSRDLRKIVQYDMTLGYIYVMEQKKGFWDVMETYIWKIHIEKIMFRFDWFMKWIWIIGDLYTVRMIVGKNKFLCRLKNKSQSFLFVWKICVCVDIQCSFVRKRRNIIFRWREAYWGALIDWVGQTNPLISSELYPFPYFPP